MTIDWMTSYCNQLQTSFVVDTVKKAEFVYDIDRLEKMKENLVWFARGLEHVGQRQARR